MRAGVGAVCAFWRGLRFFTTRALALFGVAGFAVVLVVLDLVVSGAGALGAAKPSVAHIKTAAAIFKMEVFEMAKFEVMSALIIGSVRGCSATAEQLPLKRWSACARYPRGAIL